MNCDRLHELLDDWTAGELSEELRERLEAHAAGCAECESVLRQVRDRPRSIADDDLVLRPVLAATTGRTCGQVERVLAGDPRTTGVEL
jgi:hypothetical protein